MLVHAPGLLFSCFTLLFIITVLGRGEGPGGKKGSPEDKVKPEIPQIPNTLRNKVMLLSVTSGACVHNFNHDPITYLHLVRENMHLICKRD